MLPTGTVPATKPTAGPHPKLNATASTVELELSATTVSNHLALQPGQSPQPNPLPPRTTQSTQPLRPPKSNFPPQPSPSARHSNGDSPRNQTQCRPAPDTQHNRPDRPNRALRDNPHHPPGTPRGTVPATKPTADQHHALNTTAPTAQIKRSATTLTIHPALQRGQSPQSSPLPTRTRHSTQPPRPPESNFPPQPSPSTRHSNGDSPRNQTHCRSAPHTQYNHPSRPNRTLCHNPHHPPGTPTGTVPAIKPTADPHRTLNTTTSIAQIELSATTVTIHPHSSRDSPRSRIHCQNRLHNPSNPQICGQHPQIVFLPLVTVVSKLIHVADLHQSPWIAVLVQRWWNRSHNSCTLI